MKLALKHSEAAEIIIAAFDKKILSEEEKADKIAYMLVNDWGMDQYSGTVKNNIDKDETINDVVEYIFRNILQKKDGPVSIHCDVFEAFLNLELEYIREDEDYEDEAVCMRCENRMLARCGQ